MGDTHLYMYSSIYIYRRYFCPFAFGFTMDLKENYDDDDVVDKT
jgi:hypothetical protein